MQVINIHVHRNYMTVTGEVFRIKDSTRPADLSAATRIGELEYVDSFLHLVWLFCTPSMLRTEGGCVENLEEREG